MLAWLVLILLVLLGAFMLLRGDPGMLDGLSTTDLVLLSVGAALTLIYLVVLLGEDRHKPLRALRHFAIWAAIAVALVALYSYRQELSSVVFRVAGELLPAGQGVVEAGPAGEQAVRIRRRLDGHFIARGRVNGVSVNMLVDTGASTVVLRPSDAERAGIDVASLSFTTPVRTANGTTYAAPVRLNTLAIGPIEAQGVDALVARPGSVNESLLGMSFLRRLRSYEFSGEFLTLRD